MNRGDKAALVCCSNGQKDSCRKDLKALEETLTASGLIPVWSDYIYERNSIFSGTAAERAQSLMRFYQDKEIKAIFDVSGGDIANEILPFLDFDVIAKSDKALWGYSDLTTILNAVYAKTGRRSVLYQIKNLVYDHGKEQLRSFKRSIFDGTEDLFDFKYSFCKKGACQTEEMHGVAVGGNIRCLLKLAGTEYWPDMKGKILLLEAYGGSTPQMTTYLSQLKQMGVFEQISGILLGTFTQMDKEGRRQEIIQMVENCAADKFPVAYTSGIGHGTDSSAIVIGKEISLRSISNEL
jgi:muramoyltetrapeptide carboxypeptidase